jgi:hypothetical protein
VKDLGQTIPVKRKVIVNIDFQQLVIHDVFSSSIHAGPELLSLCIHLMIVLLKYHVMSLMAMFLLNRQMGNISSYKS